ncbi:MAG: serine/threonine protein kinase, partial [Myxococcota bacterium]|nr:serine/threonine protein kinase [Myxococcota bacterium]
MRDLTGELLQAKVKTRLFGGDHAPRLGRLVLLDRIGSGAMGTVYAAYDPRLDRQVAVKILHAAGADANVRSLREARALGKLAHPNVIAIHDAGEEDGAVHVVMELVAGVPLRAWLGGARSWRAVIDVMRDAARGLAAAHQAGLVHRDIKPDNILVGHDRTRVVDFGLAGASDEPDQEGGGTPSYMAPEVLAGAPATAASDQFSFGVALYEALHGERPHTGVTRAELQAAGLRAAAARPGR